MAVTGVIGSMALFQIGIDDWQPYPERLEQFFVANGITEEGKKLAT